MKISHISKKDIPVGQEVAGHELYEGLYTLIRSEFPEFDAESYLSLAELNQYRRRYLTSLILEEKGALAKLDQEVMHAMSKGSFMSEQLTDDDSKAVSFGDRLSDQFAKFGGSWSFILTFFFFILVWMFINIWVIKHHPFDPYPFILLNLILSCIAAIQAPIIMMSQNRQEAKDRLRIEHDYKVNLRAELEIRLLNEKIDHLLVHQNKKLLELQEVQTEYLEYLIKEEKKHGK